MSSFSLVYIWLAISQMRGMALLLSGQPVYIDIRGIVYVLAAWKYDGFNVSDGRMSNVKCY